MRSPWLIRTVTSLTSNLAAARSSNALVDIKLN
jgi:hypothetical protein